MKVKQRFTRQTIGTVIQLSMLIALSYYFFNISSQIIVLYAIGIELVLALICVFFTKGK